MHTKSIVSRSLLAAALVVALVTPAHAEEPLGSGVVNLNTAGEEELTQLPGVGPSKAQAVIAWRKKFGNFKRVEDLTKVKGFGRKTFLRLKPHLALNGQTTFKSASKKPDGEGGGGGMAGRPPAMDRQ